MKDAVPGKLMTPAVQTTARDSLNSQQKPSKQKGGSEECDTRRPNSTLHSITTVQKSNKGSDSCLVSSIAGNQTSEPMKLDAGKHS